MSSQYQKYYIPISIHRQTHARLIKMGIGDKPTGVSITFDIILTHLLDELEALRQQKITFEEINKQLTHLRTEIESPTPSGQYKSVINEEDLSPSYRHYRGR